MLAYEIVDVFTDKAFAGNPLAVVYESDDLPTEALQALAREFHLSETAFPQAPGAEERSAGAHYRLRIFTPRTELPFAGHPSVGAAWAMARRGAVQPGGVVQSCGAGLLELDVAPDGGLVQLTGGTPYLSDPHDPGPYLAAAGLDAGDLGGPPLRLAGTGITFAYLPVVPDAVARAHPDLGALDAVAALAPDVAAAEAGTFAGVSVVSWDGSQAHVRVFAGEVGVTEDPATGSAALGLGVWLVAGGLVPGDGATAYDVHQGAEMGRPSLLRCRVEASAGRAVRCHVAGEVVPVAAGMVRVP